MADIDISDYPCVYYNTKLKQNIPCFLLKNYITEYNHMSGRNFSVQIIPDESKYVEYNLSQNKILKYVFELIPINEIYPYSTQEEIDYADSVIPDKISPTHIQDELKRYDKIIEILCDVPEITGTTYEKIASFISYELLFTLHTSEERVFMFGLSQVLLTEIPENILTPYLINMTYNFCTKYNDIGFSRIFKIFNYNHYSHALYIQFPLEVNKDILKANVIFLHPHLTF